MCITLGWFSIDKNGHDFSKKQSFLWSKSAFAESIAIKHVSLACQHGILELQVDTTPLWKGVSIKLLNQ
jgi:hypothetical protein